VRTDLKGLRAEVDVGAAPKLDELAATLDDTVGDVRHIANELRPDALDKHGLVPALEWLCNEFDRRSGITCGFSTDAREIPLGPERALLVYRIVEEALTNVSVHAPGSSARVRATLRGDDVRFEVTDDGPGFDPASVRPDAVGVAGMRERAGLLGARLAIAPGDGGGTLVELTVGAG